METAKILKSLLVAIPNTIVTILIENTQTQILTMNPIVIVSIVISLMLFVIAYFGLSWKEKNDEQREELEQIILLMFKNNEQLFNKYLNELNSRKHKFNTKNWRFLKDVDDIKHSIEERIKNPKIAK